MEGKRNYGKTLRWTLAVAAGLLFHLGLFWSVFLTRETDQKLKRSTRQFTKIQYFDASARERSEALDQQIDMFDPRPLLLPTKWNAANQERNFIREEESIFQELDPMFELEDGNYLDDFGNVSAYYDRLTLAQSDFEVSLFDQIGRRQVEAATETDVGLELNLIDPKSGERLRSATIYNSEVELLNSSWPSWRPALFLTNVENTFQVGGFAVLESSGYDSADEILRTQTRLMFAELGLLGDGVYLVEIVP